MNGRDAASELVKAANGAAEILHQETGAPYVLVILAGEKDTAHVVGGWVPGVSEIRRICAELIDRIDAGKVTVRSKVQVP